MAEKEVLSRAGMASKISARVVITLDLLAGKTSSSLPSLQENIESVSTLLHRKLFSGSSDLFSF